MKTPTGMGKNGESQFAKNTRMHRALMPGMVAILVVLGGRCDNDSSDTITAPEPYSLQVVAPNGGEEWEYGSTQTISWTSSGFDGSVRIGLYAGGVAEANLDRELVDATENDGEYDLMVPFDEDPGTEYRIGIRKVGDETVVDFSDNPITLAKPANAFKVIGPNGGEVYTSGDTMQIEWWSDSTVVAGAIVSLSIDDGESWFSLSAESSVSPGFDSLAWPIPDSLRNGFNMVPVASTTCLIKVREYNLEQYSDRSDSVFSIE